MAEAGGERWPWLYLLVAVLSHGSGVVGGVGQPRGTGGHARGCNLVASLVEVLGPACTWWPCWARVQLSVCA